MPTDPCYVKDDWRRLVMQAIARDTCRYRCLSKPCHLAGAIGSDNKRQRHRTVPLHFLTTRAFDQDL